jgi:hypothetical protein
LLLCEVESAPLIEIPPCPPPLLLLPKFGAQDLSSALPFVLLTMRL